MQWDLRQGRNRVKFALKFLNLSLKRGEERIQLHDLGYFWGQMGAGKTSIARLIDYCLGGDIELSPALQNEFVAATLELELSGGELSIERFRGAGSVLARWGDSSQAVIPARDAAGEVIPGSGVQVLSDMIFWLSGLTAPRVRKSKQQQDSELARLSIRDLLWYCYLDQDEIDSSFFHLEDGAHPFKRLKSRDVLRYVIGFHDEHVAELEAELDELRGKRQAMAASIESLIRALIEVGVESEAQIAERARELRARADQIREKIQAARVQLAEHQTVHASDSLREEGVRVSEQLTGIESALREIRRALDQDVRHLNEIETLSIKMHRSASARAILSEVEFECCPRCTQSLPSRDVKSCYVCGQPQDLDDASEAEAQLVTRDIKQRAAELRDIISKHESSLARALLERDALSSKKTRIDRERNEASSQYDSAYLSGMLVMERERASLIQDADNLSSLIRLPRMLDAQREQLSEIQARELQLRIDLREARRAAEGDISNLDDLKELFIDCLVRAGVPGITEEDRADITPPTFFPLIYGPSPDDMTVTSFATLSSGGKKTLFKCCFAIAVHRLATRLGAPLPELLLIDSPMKNISERENRAQFEGFYEMVYQLKAGELAGTQIIIIDKEYSPPSPLLGVDVHDRHMRPGDPDNPPLIPYYNGK
jgi:hypothetical protein